MWNDPGWAFGVAFIILAISVRRALPHLLQTIADARAERAHTQPDGGVLAEELEEVRTRLGELEERVDFAERLLAQQRESQGLAPPRQ